MESTVTPAVQAVLDQLLRNEKIQHALAFLERDQDAKIAELKEMVLLHGAYRREGEVRAPMFKAKLEQCGLADVRIDAHDNAYGVVRGGGGAASVLFEAHLDTVFPKETPLAVTEKEGRLFCPGIGDDTAGLATVLSVLRAIAHAGLTPVHSLIAGGTSGEEGEGDLRGIKGLLDDTPGIAGCVSMEPDPAGRITYGGVGSKRYEFVFAGPGGHSWNAYGLPSPLHAMGRAIAKTAGVRTPEEPRATYTVGVVSGGSSVNSIAEEGRYKLDMRSVSASELAALERVMLGFAREGAEEENAFRAASGACVTVEARCIGDRPAGSQSADSRIVQAAWAAAKAAGAEPRLLPPSSTNANVPISRGIPAVVIRTGGDVGGVHTLNEWFNPAGSETGAKHALLLLFALAGLEGVTEPLLQMMETTATL